MNRHRYGWIVADWGGTVTFKRRRESGRSPFGVESYGVQHTKKPSLNGIESKWLERWDDSGVYDFDGSKNREDIFSIDTPPPTGERLAARRARVFIYAHGHDRAVPADAG